MVLMQPISRIRSSDTCSELYSSRDHLVSAYIEASMIMGF